MFEGKLFEMDKDQPFSGLVFNTYPDGQKEYEGKYEEVNQLLNPILMKIQSSPEEGMPQEQAFTDDPVVDEID